MKKLIFTDLVFTIILVALISFSTPNKTNLGLYLLVLVLIYLLGFSTVFTLLKFVSIKLSKSMQLFCSGILAFIPVTLIGISSIGGITIIDIILSVSLPTLIVWYIIKANSGK